MSYSRRYVPVPKDSNAPLNKEQFLARVSGLSTDLALARYRYEHGLACTLAGMKDQARAAFLQVRRIDPAYKRARVASTMKMAGY